MLRNFLEIAAGLFLVFFSHWLTIIRIRHLLEKYAHKWKAAAILASVLPQIFFIGFEVIGLDLLVSPLIPGEAIIRVEAKELVTKNTAPYDLRAEIAVVNWGGKLDPEKRFWGKFDQRGTYSALVDFAWLQSNVRIRVFKQSKPDESIEIIWKHVSPWSRLGLWQTEIHVSH